MCVSALQKPMHAASVPPPPPSVLVSGCLGPPPSKLIVLAVVGGGVGKADVASGLAIVALTLAADGVVAVVA